MNKKLYCKSCGKYLGEIRDANLYKYIVYLCKSCYNKKLKDNTVDSMFTKLFGGY